MATVNLHQRFATRRLGVRRGSNQSRLSTVALQISQRYDANCAISIPNSLTLATISNTASGLFSEPENDEYKKDLLRKH